ncbi:MAG TPA: hypothetical protein VKT77_08035, partial [Chthonomonadaceae bacterium]|nr:hypothetical protein [Chthonomonadaceae bacterium]
MPFRNRPFRWFWLASALLVTGCILAAAQDDTSLTLASLAQSLKGKPSSRVIERAKPRLQASRKAYASSHHDYAAEIDQTRLKRRSEIASLPTGQVKSRKAQVQPHKPGKPAPPAPFIDTIRTPYQNMDLAIVGPKDVPIAGLAIAVTVHRKSLSTPGAVEDVDWAKQQGAQFVTDATGKVHLTKVGPLPVTIDVSFPGDIAKEWSITAPAAATITMAAGEGTSKDVPGAPIGVYPGKVALDVAPPMQPVVLPASGLRLAAFGGPQSTRGKAGAKRSASGSQKSAPKVQQKFADVIYDSPTPKKVPVEHNVVELQVQNAEPGSTLTSPATPEQTWTAQPDGTAVCKLPVAALGGGPAPIRVALDRAGNESEAVITTYDADPYKTNSVTCPKLVLVRLRDVNLAGGVGVLDDAGAISRALGSEHADATTETDRSAGLSRWRFSNMDALMRPWIDPDRPALCERLELGSKAAGTIGGIAIGASRADVRRALGDPEANAHGGSGDSYLDGGVAIVYDNDTVAEIRVQRPTVLLKEGTTAFVPRERTRLFIESFDGDPATGIGTIQQLGDYLGQIGAVEIVKTREEADIVLKASATFEEHKDGYVGVLPFKYDCRVKVEYELTNAATGKSVRDTADVPAGADYADEVESDQEMLRLLTAP